MHDHPGVVVTWSVTNKGGLFDALYEQPTRAYQLLRRGPLASLGQIAVVMRTEAKLSAPDLQLGLALLGADAGLPPFQDLKVACRTALLTPRSRGHVRLKSPDVADSPIVDPRYLTADEDKIRLRQGVAKTLELFASPTLQALAGSSTLPPLDADAAALDTFIEQNTTTYWHPVGTARMGTDADSVVGPDLAVHGIDGLYVADASVMPTITRGNTQAPVIAIAERAADLLR